MFEPFTPVHFLRRATRLFPERTAVIDGPRRYTYRILAERVNRLFDTPHRAELRRITAQVQVLALCSTDAML